MDARASGHMNKSIRHTLAETTQVLHVAGISDARMEAVSLLAHALHADRTFVITHLEEELEGDQLQSCREFVMRRARREPLQYIVGHQEFFELDFNVTPDVLIPRPETELVVEAALDVRGADAPFIADIGTGSGCIVISLLHKLQDARGVGVDISSRALRVAQKNARHHRVAHRLSLVQSDQFAALQRCAQFSTIVSNPPYVPAPEINTLPPEVREHEPLAALVSGSDGLAHIRGLLRDAAALLQTGGHLVFEIGFGQRDPVAKLIDRATWRLIEIRKDLQSIPRTLVLQKR